MRHYFYIYLCKLLDNQFFIYTFLPHLSSSRIFCLYIYILEYIKVRKSSLLDIYWDRPVVIVCFHDSRLCMLHTFHGSHPDVSRNYQNRVVSVKHNLIYSLITIRLATSFNPTESSSGLLHEPINVRKLYTVLESQQCLQR
jgi:hypothetical protein